jgi:predicted transcriptional regulator
MTPIKPTVDPSCRFSIKQTAKVLGVSERTIQRKIKAGDMQAQRRKLDKKRYVTGLEILKAWNSNF